MHQKKIPRVKNILHSIPILRKKVYSKKNSSSLPSFLNNRSIVIKNKHLRYVSSNIPLCCIVALLLLSIGLIVPVSEYHNVVYADEVAPTAETTEETTSSLIIGGAGVDETVMASAGDVAYRKHTVTVDATNSDSFYLMIKGPERLRGSTKISGAGGNTPEEMPDNSWGYAYSESDEEAALSYQSFDGTMQTIDSGTEAGKFTKNLIFAAKFGNSAAAGNYTGTVTLSLAATPAELVSPNDPVYKWDKLEYLQQMTPEACKNAPLADGSYPSTTLTDSRETTSTYSITRLADGNCWMTQNLRITNKTLTAADSDVSEAGYTVPSSSSSWDKSDTAQQALYNNNEVYGAYYSWCAATANSCDSGIAAGEASYSICPKGWRLPSRYEYENLVSIGALKGVNKSETRDGYAGFNIGGGFLPYGGFITYTGTSGINERGLFWASTANTTTKAYSLNLPWASGTPVKSDWARAGGLSVRCIAKTIADRPAETPIQYTPVDSWDELEYLQQMGDGITHSTICNKIAVGTSKTVIDSRDNNEYTIAKLADNNCWMTQNLRIINKELSSLDSDLDPSGGNYIIPKSSSDWSNNNTTQQAMYNNNEIYGAYYSWCTATANSCNITSGEAPYSICPRGWKLPSQGEYENLVSAGNTSGTNGPSTVNNHKGYNFAGGFFPFNGVLTYTGFTSINERGLFWISTADTGAKAYVLDIPWASGTPVKAGWARAGGLAIRCMAR